MLDLNGQKMTYFGGTSYLGMASLPEFQDILFNQIKQWGTAYGSSRNANVQLAIYDEAEKAFAKYIGAEDVICVSSGMLAGQLVLATLRDENSVFFHHPQAHPAIVVAGSNPLFIGDHLHQELCKSGHQSIVICVDSMPAMHTTAVDLSFLKKIHPDKEITLVIDESHALGLVGSAGGGIYAEIPAGILSRKIAVSSLGKALGLAGGMIGATKAFTATIRASAQFVSASGANPAYLGAFLKASHLYAQQRSILAGHLAYIDLHLKPSAQIAFDKAYPVLYCKESTLADVLYTHGIVITKFKYPTYPSEMLRIVISAHHHKEDIEKLINIVNSYT